jgi:anthranilate synthase/aminodeoxychorismate synthase-like glutamine amidotransferase
MKNCDQTKMKLCFVFCDSHLKFYFNAVSEGGGAIGIAVLYREPSYQGRQCEGGWEEGHSADDMKEAEWVFFNGGCPYCLARAEDGIDGRGWPQPRVSGGRRLLTGADVPECATRQPTSRRVTLASISILGVCMLLLIDNYDSFTWNLVQYFGALGEKVVVKRNDELTLADIEAMAPDRLVISPGPCTPNEAGISLAAIAHFAGRLPILGVCLGHQSLAQVFGAEVVRARRVMHGKTSLIRHQGEGVFAGLNNPLRVTRYHSLVVKAQTLPDCLAVTAWSEHEDGSVDEIMGLRHKTLAVEGVQFHPESVLSEQGHELLANFLVRR